VLAVTRARLGDSFAAEEAAVDALGRAARGIRSLRDPGAWPKWLARIAARCAVDAAKRSAGVVAPATEAVSADPGPVEAAAREERARRIRTAVAGLPSRFREPVLLHFVEGLSYREIAATLGTGLSTVARRMEKALGSLRRSLGGEP
jgi:RNA polymerase sigma-70 factor (ECF subfamily)